MATKPVSRAQAAKIARRSDTVGAYAGKGWVQAVAFVMLLGFTIMAVQIGRASCRERVSSPV